MTQRLIMWRDETGAAQFQPFDDDLHDQLVRALARIAELEAQIAAQPKPRAPRKPRTPVTEPCQACGDIKTEKIIYNGLPACGGVNYEWKKCASRIRRNRDSGMYVAFIYDRRYRTRKENDRWVARFNGEAIAITVSQAESRRHAFDHWLAAQAAAKAEEVAV